MPTVTDEQSPSPTPSPSRNPFGLGFRPAKPGDLPSNDLPSPSTSPESIEREALASDSGDDWDAANYPESPDDTPSQGSTPAFEPVAVDIFTEDELRVFARGGVAVAGEKAHDLFANTHGQQTVGLYKTDEADQVNIGDPLASIAARRQGIAGKVNPDTKDLLSALVGVFGYLTKQINRRVEARTIDAGAGSPQPMPEPVDL